VGRDPVSIKSTFDAGDLIARLGGEGASNGLNFNYGDVVAVIQARPTPRRSWFHGEWRRTAIGIHYAGAVAPERNRLGTYIPESSRPQTDNDAEKHWTGCSRICGLEK